MNIFIPPHVNPPRDPWDWDAYDRAFLAFQSVDPWLNGQVPVPTSYESVQAMIDFIRVRPAGATLFGFVPVLGAMDAELAAFSVSFDAWNRDLTPLQFGGSSKVSVCEEPPLVEIVSVPQPDGLNAWTHWA